MQITTRDVTFCMNYDPDGLGLRSDDCGGRAFRLDDRFRLWPDSLGLRLRRVGVRKSMQITTRDVTFCMNYDSGRLRLGLRLDNRLGLDERGFEVHRRSDDRRLERRLRFGDDVVALGEELEAGSVELAPRPRQTAPRNGGAASGIVHRGRTSGRHQRRLRRAPIEDHPSPRCAQALRVVGAERLATGRGHRDRIQPHLTREGVVADAHLCFSATSGAPARPTHRGPRYRRPGRTRPMNRHVLRLTGGAA